MPKKTLLFGIIVVCVTILILTALARNTLCVFQVNAGQVQVKAQLAYEAD